MTWPEAFFGAVIVVCVTLVLLNVEFRIKFKNPDDDSGSEP